MRLTQAMRENRATIVAGLVVCAVLAWAFQPLMGRKATGARLVARVHDGNGAVHELPLDEDAELEVVTELGRNVIVVRGGKALVAEADCPSGDCLRQQAIGTPGQQLICLPHRLWVEVVEEGADGGEMDVLAVTSASDEPDADQGVDLVSR